MQIAYAGQNREVYDNEKVKNNVTTLNNDKVGSNTWFLTEDGLYECKQNDD